LLFFLRLLTTVTFLFGPVLSLAQDWYQIEVIIFEHSEEVQAEQTPENWPNVLDLNWPSPLIDLEPALERDESPAIKPPFEELTFDERNLNNDSYAIRVRDAYNLLWHKAWTAPLQPEAQAPWIRVQAGEQIGDHYQLEGALRIHLSRYLHMHTNLWLTEVSGEPIIEQPASAVENMDAGEDSFDLYQMAADVNADSRFDWSQLPAVYNVPWGCNFVRESWPEDQRLLPADYYEDPAPADWYFPFGCRIPSEIPEKDLPIYVNYPTSNFLYRAEIEKQFPGFMDALQLTNAHQDSQDLESIPMEPSRLTTNLSFQNPLPDQTVAGFQPTENQTNGNSEPETLEHLATQQAKIRYQVEEIVHIQSERRMRSAEFHYIDHPKVGILAVIYPVEKPDLETDDSALSEQE
jgi:hypothetical protein